MNGSQSTYIEQVQGHVAECQKTNKTPIVVCFGPTAAGKTCFFERDIQPLHLVEWDQRCTVENTHEGKDKGCGIWIETNDEEQRLKAMKEISEALFLEFKGKSMAEKLAQSDEEETTSVLGVRKVSEVEASSAHAQKRKYIGPYCPDYSFTETKPVDEVDVRNSLQMEEHSVYGSLQEVAEGRSSSSLSRLVGPAVVIYEKTSSGIYYHIVDEDRYAAEGPPKPTVSFNTSQNSVKTCLMYHKNVANHVETLNVGELIDSNVVAAAVANEMRIRAAGLSYPMVFLREGLKKGAEEDIVQRFVNNNKMQDAVQFIATVVLPRLLKEELHQRMVNPELLQTLQPVFYAGNGEMLQPVFMLSRQMLCGHKDAIEIASRMPTLVTPKALPLQGDANVQKLMKFFDGSPDPKYFTFDKKKGYWKVKCDYNELRGVLIDKYSEKKILSSAHFYTFDDIRSRLVQYMQRCFDKKYQLSRWGQHLFIHEKAIRLMREFTEAAV